MPHRDEHAEPRTLADQVAAATGVSPVSCYQCGRCAAGCPQNVPGEMDVSPTRLMRLLQLEAAFADDPEQARAFADTALSAETCWLCAGCMTCTTRCPQQVDIAGTMDLLRQEATRRGVAAATPRARDIQAFHRTFLDAVLFSGRMHELSLVMRYKLLTGHLLQDAMLGPAMLRKGKLRIVPRRGPDTSRVRQAIRRLKGQRVAGAESSNPRQGHSSVATGASQTQPQAPASSDTGGRGR